MQAEPIFERLSSGDPATVDAVVGLYRSAGWWDDATGDAHGRAIIPDMIAGSFCFLVARDADGRIIGMGRALSDGVSDAYIQDVVVLPEFRGRGIGAELVTRLARYCEDEGLVWIGLIAEPGTLSFYERLGFGALKGYQPMRFRGTARR